MTYLTPAKDRDILAKLKEDKKNTQVTGITTTGSSINIRTNHGSLSLRYGYTNIPTNCGAVMIYGIRLFRGNYNPEIAMQALTLALKYYFGSHVRRRGLYYTCTSRQRLLRERMEASGWETQPFVWRNTNSGNNIHTLLMRA